MSPTVWGGPSPVGGPWDLPHRRDPWGHRAGSLVGVGRGLGPGMCRAGRSIGQAWSLRISRWMSSPCKRPTCHPSCWSARPWRHTAIMGSVFTMGDRCRPRRAVCLDGAVGSVLWPLQGSLWPLPRHGVRLGGCCTPCTAYMGCVFLLAAGCRWGCSSSPSTPQSPPPGSRWSGCASHRRWPSSRMSWTCRSPLCSSATSMALPRLTGITSRRVLVLEPLALSLWTFSAPAVRGLMSRPP